MQTFVFVYHRYDISSKSTTDHKKSFMSRDILTAQVQMLIHLNKLNKDDHYKYQYWSDDLRPGDTI